MLDLRTCLGLLLLATGASCGDDGPQFNVKYAEGFTQGPTTVSMFGVYRDGRMSPESWAQFGAPLAASFGQATCDADYGDRLEHENPDLFGSVDEETKSDGITDELLGRLAPAAEGDLILTVSVNGRIVAKGGEPAAKSAPPTTQAPGRGGQRGQRIPGRGAPPAAVPDRRLELSASLYSVRLHRSVAVVNMKYGGQSVEEAVGQLVDKVRTVLPGTTCRGWRSQAAAPGAAPSAPP